MFYNTGISTYVWIVTNRKRKERRGKIQLINAVDLFVKMRKSLGNKRNELANAQHRRDRRVVRRRDPERSLEGFRQRGFRLPPDHGRAPAAARLPGDAGADFRAEGRIGVSEARDLEKKGKDGQKEIEAGEDLQQEIVAMLEGWPVRSNMDRPVV